MLGPGKHDELVTLVREKLGMGNTGGVILIVLDGKNSGFACQADLETTMAIPEILDNIAREIRADRGKGKL